MRAVTRFLKGVGVLVLCGAGTVSAQHPQTREGFWIGFGFGGGSAHLSCGSGCAFYDNFKGGGPTGYVKLGGTLSQSVLLGGEVNAWVKDVSGSTETVGNVSAALYLYPQPKSGFFLKGGVGYSTYEISDGGTATGNGFGLLAGLGYDIRVGRNISITPTGNFYFGSDGDVSDNGVTVIPSVKHTIVDLGLGITFH